MYAPTNFRRGSFWRFASPAVSSTWMPRSFGVREANRCPGRTPKGTRREANCSHHRKLHRPETASCSARVGVSLRASRPWRSLHSVVDCACQRRLRNAARSRALRRGSLVRGAWATCSSASVGPQCPSLGCVSRVRSRAGRRTSACVRCNVLPRSC